MQHGWIPSSTCLAYRTAFLLLFALLGNFSASAQTTRKTPVKKKPAVTTAAKRTTGRNSKTIAASTRRSRTAGTREEVSAGTKRTGTRKVVVTRKLVHGHWVRTTQVVRSAPAAPSSQLHPDSERYQQIQQALASNGYFKGEANGQWGDDSVAALKQFQTDHKLVNDGKISSLSLINLGLGPNRETGSKPAAKDTAESTLAPAAPGAEPVHN